MDTGNYSATSNNTKVVHWPLMGGLLHFGTARRGLGERYYVTFALCNEPSVCRLSVTLLHPRHRVEIFGNIFAPPNTSRTRTVCIKILGKKFEGVRGDRASEIQGV